MTDKQMTDNINENWILLLQQYWIPLVIVLILALAIAWWIFAASRRTRIEIETTEPEETTSAKRNQALIDAPPAASPTTPPAMPTVPSVSPSGAAAPASPSSSSGDIAPAGKPTAAHDPAPQSSTPTAPPAATPTAATPTETEPSAAPAEPQPPKVSQSAPQTPADASKELMRIKGIGPKLASQLQEMGITSIEQIAAWDDAKIDEIDARLGRFQGRIRRDAWPEQAQLLTSGDTAAYENKFGKL